MDVRDFRRLTAFYNDSFDEVEQMAIIIAEMYGFAYDEVNNFSRVQWVKYNIKVTNVFSKVEKKPFWYLKRLNTDAKKITLGQFIEIQHWLKEGEMQQMHLIAASLINGKNHVKTANKILNSNVRYYYSDVKAFLVSYQDLLSEYSGLFEQDETDDDVETVKPHYFIMRYGWIFSALQVAKLNGITLDQAYNLPIMQALNDLSYLKAEQQYNKWLQKQ